MLRFGLAEKKLNRRQAVALLIITAVLWSSGGLLIKLIPWHPIAIAGGRSALAAIILAAVIRRPRWSGSPAQWGATLVYVGTVVFFVAATKLTTAATAILLQYTAPVYVALFGAWFLHERTTRADWLTVLVVLGGMVLFFLDSLTPGRILGNICGILSGISFGAMALFLRKQKDGSPLESVLCGNLLTLLIALPFFVRQPALDTAGWLALLALGVFQLGIPYLLYCLAIKYVSALDAILIPVIEPVLNPLWVLLLLAEVPGPRTIAGGILVLCAVTVRCLLPARGQEQKTDQAA
ncbi:MAG TPA: DMT family transporter [Firmicutes bacterium]|nr:DMT family transporter [Bacillota bacterium]